jgi:DNA-directed RNA polymerase subunit K/omega
MVASHPRVPITRRRKKVPVVQRPSGTNPFEFVVVSGLRAAQLMRGCIPRVDRQHKVITTAQIEVATGKVARIPLGTVPVVPE